MLNRLPNGRRFGQGLFRYKEEAHSSPPAEAGVSCANYDEKALRRAEKYDEAIRLLERMREMDNKAIVRAFIEEVFNAWDVSNLDKFMREDYRQHNPGVEDGRAGFVKFCEFFFSKHPHMEIVHLIGDGDLVAVFFKCTVDDGVNKVVDIYRLQDGKIAEHWDVVEHGIDPDAKGASGNGLF